MAGARVDISPSSSSYSSHSSFSSLLESRTWSEPFFLSVDEAVPSGSTDFTRNLYSKPELTATETSTSVYYAIFWSGNSEYFQKLPASVGNNSWYGCNCPRHDDHLLNQIWTGDKPREPKTFWSGRKSSDFLNQTWDFFFIFLVCFHPLNCKYARIPPGAN